jgi:hypothetical protein
MIRDDIRIRSAAGHNLKVSIFHLQSHRAFPSRCDFAMAPNLVNDHSKLNLHILERLKITAECLLRPYRLADPVGTHRPIIDAAGNPSSAGVVRRYTLP